MWTLSSRAKSNVSLVQLPHSWDIKIHVSATVRVYRTILSIQNAYLAKQWSSQH